MAYCGPQYAGKTCSCQLQVVPGVTVATQEAANPLRICAYREEGIQYACDPGCCSTDCSKDEKKTDETAAPENPFGRPWFVILVGLIFGLMLFGAIIYRRTVRNGLKRV